MLMYVGVNLDRFSVGFMFMVMFSASISMVSWVLCLIIIILLNVVLFLTGKCLFNDDKDQAQQDDKDLGALAVHPDQVVFETDEKFLSIALDISFMHCKFHILNDAQWQEIEKFGGLLSPAYLRFGGTEADNAVFDLKIDPKKRKIDCGAPPKGNFIISDRDWDKINSFAKKIKMNLILDFNVLLRHKSDWNSSNADAVLKYSEKRNYALDFQLGNEPNSFPRTFKKVVTPSQLAKDYASLKKLLQKTKLYRNSKLIGPEVTRPRRLGTSSLHFLEEFLAEGISVDVVSWHQYYLNGRTATLKDFTDPKTFDALNEQIDSVKKLVHKYSEKIPIWISETSSAYGGGAPKLSDRFVASFLWLDKLGMAARGGMSVVIRQSLFMDAYSLVDKQYSPTPDFWISFFYKNVVGKKVLQLTIGTSVGKHLRLYCHCANSKSAVKGNIVIYGMNLSNQTETFSPSGLTIEYPIKAFVFRSELNNLTSKFITLNSVVLKFNKTIFNDLAKMEENINLPLILPPYSLGFWVLQHTQKSACDS